jgi:hypothetical protein
MRTERDFEVRNGSICRYIRLFKTVTPSEWNVFS